MNKLLLFAKKYYPALIFILIYFVVFYKTFIYGLVPFPGDLLVSRFFPYSSGGWDGFSQWTTHKEFILADVVRQIYPWRILSMDLIKEGIVPLWNIYSFSGTPLLANLQSSVFYPVNILFFITGNKIAWITYIMLQPVLAAFFMYLFIRTLKLSKIASIFGGIGYAFTGYMMVWFEMGTVGHTALWLPFILWGITKYINTKLIRYLILSSFGIAFSIFSGHAQTAVYILIFSLIYYFYIGWSRLKKWEIIIGIFILLLGVMLTAIQIIPTLELSMLSARDSASSAETFHKFIIPWSHIAMLFSPDFFGNPATGNFWGIDYGEFQSYCGVVVLLFSAIGFYSNYKNKNVRLLIATAGISFLLAFQTPLAELLFQSHFPVLSTSLPSRILFLATFSLIVAAAYGVESVMNKKTQWKNILIPTLFILSIYVIFWIFVFTSNIDPLNLSVSKRNLIIPTFIIFSMGGVIIITLKFKRFIFLVLIASFAFMGLEYSYYWNKYLPFSSSNYMFPSHNFLKELQTMSKFDRVYGANSASIATNLSILWKIQNAEGYDPLYVRKYGELVESAEEGKFSKKIPRSDAIIPNTDPVDDTHGKQVLLNLLGTKYVLDKDDNIPDNWDPKNDHFISSRFELIYQNFKWKIYKNLNYIPRAAIFYDYEVILEKKKTLDKLFEEKFPYQTKLILESSPAFSAKNISASAATIIKYSSNYIEIKSNTKQNGLLFFSDNNYPGWRARVDGSPAKIITANHTFRVVEVPKGEHIIIFEYIPYSFYFGAAISAISLFALGFIYQKYKKINSR